MGKNFYGLSRLVNCNIWTADNFVDLNTQSRYMLFYILTNQQTNLLGIYRLDLRRAEFDTGLTREQIKDELNILEKSDFIRYSSTTSEVAIRNWLRFGIFNGSAISQGHLLRYLGEVRDIELVKYVYANIKGHSEVEYSGAISAVLDAMKSKIGWADVKPVQMTEEESEIFA